MVKMRLTGADRQGGDRRKQGARMSRTRVFNVVVCSAVLGFSLSAQGDTGDVEQALGPQSSWKQTDPGPASALWHRADLPPGEQAYLDHAAQNPNADAINTAYASATAERAEEAMHAAAADQLGIEALGEEGVVP